MTKISDAEVRQELERIVASPVFLRSEKLARFLRYIVEKTLDGEGDTLKEYALGVHVYNRKQDYEPRTDATVRVEATRLRTKLMEYYSSTEVSGIRIELPKGSYVPRFAPVAEMPANLPVPPLLERPRLAGWWIALGALTLAALLGGIAWKLRTATAREPGSDAKRHFLEAHRLWAMTPLNEPLRPVIAEFEKAVAADPSFARGWADLGAAEDAQSDVDREGRNEWLAKAKAAELRAIELDPGLAAPHKLLGTRYLMQHWQFADAVRELAKAVELAPNDSHTAFIYISALAISGNLEEADRQSEAALLRNPRDSETSAVRAQVHLWWHRARKARELAQRAVDLEPGSGFARWMAGLAAQVDGDLAAAEAQYEEAIKRNRNDGRAAAALAQLRAQQGRVEEAHGILKEVMARYNAREGWHYVWAMVHAASGQKALALDALDLAVRDREGSAPYAALEPRFESLHGEARFQQIVSSLKEH